MNINSHPQLIRKPEVLSLTGLSKSTLYNRINAGLFPAPISLGGLRAVAFVFSEVNAVIEAMIAGQSPEQIRQLVKNLIEERQTGFKKTGGTL